MHLLAYAMQLHYCYGSMFATKEDNNDTDNMEHWCTDSLEPKSNIQQSTENLNNVKDRTFRNMFKND